MLSPFVSWCIQQGAITQLELCGESSTYRYMRYDPINVSITTSPTIQGEILKIPLKTCIIADTPESLSHKLLKEKELGQDSFYAPYIDVLPTLEKDTKNDMFVGTLSTLPRFWNDERKELVTKADGGQMERRLVQDYRKDVDPWAYACVSSRANYVLGHGFAMTPILDMINHDSSVTTTAKIVKDNNGVDVDEELHLFIGDSFDIGEEVFISYGDLTNLDTLCNYGFVSEMNQSNKETVDILLMGSAPVQVEISQMDGSIDNTALSILRSSISVVARDNNDGMDEEVYSLIASFIDEAIYDANEGAGKSIEQGDDLVTKYLQCRSATLQRGLDRIKNKFPEIEL